MTIPVAHPHQPLEVQAHLRHHRRVLSRPIHAIPPRRTAHLHATQLPPQRHVELAQPLVTPLHARAHHRCGETLLEHPDGVPHETEIYEAQLEDVVAEVALEDDGAGPGGDDGGAGGEVGGAGEVVEGEADEVGDVLLGWG